MRLLVLTLLTFKKVNLIFGHPVCGYCDFFLQNLEPKVTDP